MMSVAESYYSCGVGHANAADILHRELHRRASSRDKVTWISLQSIIGFALENSLKSFLSVRGLSEKEIRKHGHNLRSLLRASRENGLAEACSREGQPWLVEALEEFFERWADDFTSNHYRYLRAETVAVLDGGKSTEKAIQSARVILDAVQIDLA